MVYYLPEARPILSSNPWLDGIGLPTSATFAAMGYLHHCAVGVKGKITAFKEISIYFHDEADRLTEVYFVSGGLMRKSFQHAVAQIVVITGVALNNALPIPALAGASATGEAAKQENFNEEKRVIIQFEGTTESNISGGLHIIHPEQLDLLARWLIDHPSRFCVLNGHVNAPKTEIFPSPQFELDLSVARARTLRAELVKRGVDSTKLEDVGRSGKDYNMIGLDGDPDRNMSVTVDCPMFSWDQPHTLSSFALTKLRVMNPALRAAAPSTESRLRLTMKDGRDATTLAL